MAYPLVHVLVINWNGKEHLEECFESLLAGDYPNARFVLVDNASDDGSVAFVQERFGADPEVEILELAQNSGWSGGNNAGIERALADGAEYIFLLNNDTTTDTKAIGQLVKLAEEDAAIGALAPKILLYDHPFLLNSIGLDATDIGTAWDRGMGRVDGPKWGGHRPVVGVCGAAFFLRAEALRKTGLLPTDFEIYLDDLDLSLRIWNAGYEILTCPEAVVKHKFSSTMGQRTRARRKYYLNTRNRMRLIERNYPTSKLGGILFRYAVGEAKAISRAMLEGAFWRVWAHKRSWLDALIYLPRARAERRRREEEGLAECRFWDLLRTDILFFPGIELPVDGWYTPISIDGATVVPMSSEAHYDHKGGALEVTQMNPFPQLGPYLIRVLHDGEVVATLSGSERRVTTLDLAKGRIEFRAETIFEAEQTGEDFDIGGWLQLRDL